jgi:hypothetical protein
MNPQELAKAIEALILEADSRYVTAIGKIQNSLYDDLATILKDLELQDGYIKQNAANRKILNKADNKIQETFTSNKYTTAINNYIAIVPRIDLNNVKYFTSIEESFKPSRIFLKNLQNDTIATIEKYVLRDGLQSQVISPLSQILSQNINSGGQFSGFLEQVRNYVKGTKEVEGRAMSYTRTYLRDSLFTYSRTFQQSLTNDLGLEFYLYSGGLIETSRPFCIERAGQYFSHKEIESWAGLEWAGKKAGTTESSIFLFAAGWNCAHQIIPVHKSVVPQDVIDRQ